MKAIIMAGGEGRRLKAISGDTPKPMVSLLGKPIMEHIIELLRSQDICDICAAVKYRAGDIIGHFGDGSDFGVKLSYKIEKEPLGTAGACKNCRDFYADEDFLVISGDAACDFNLRELINAHREKRADLSIALYKNSEPLNYGLAVRDENSFIKAFIEKPSWSRVVTDFVNTGIYVISPSVMELVPDNCFFDFGNELFPLLLEKNFKIMGFPMEGNWCDVGNPLSYYKCCVDALEGRLKINPAREFINAPAPEEDLTEENCSASVKCSCKNRAELMEALSTALMEMDADYSDGIRLIRPHFKMHISPLSSCSQLRIAVSAANEEYAKSLALSAKELAEAFNL